MDMFVGFFMLLAAAVASFSEAHGSEQLPAVDDKAIVEAQKLVFEPKLPLVDDHAISETLKLKF